MKPSTEKLLYLRENRTFAEMFRLICENKDKIAAEYSEDGQIKQYTYRDFEKTARKIASRFGELLGDETRGRYIGLHLDNCPEWLCIFWGALMAGYSPILLDFRAREETLLHLLDQSRTIAIVSAEKNPIKQGVPQYSVEEMLSACDAPDDWRPTWATQIALCTSGTTSTSRVFVYDERTLLSNVAGGWQLSEDVLFLAEPDAKLLAFIPFHHIYGLFTLGIWPLIFGSTIVYLKDRAPSSFLEASRKHGVTNIYGVPLLWNNLCNKILAGLNQKSWPKRVVFRLLCEFSLGLQKIFPVGGSRFAYRRLFGRLHENILGPKLRIIVSGGAFLSPSTLRLLSAMGFLMISGYGMTEAGMIAIESGKNFRRKMKNSLGKAFTSVEIKIASDGKADVGEVYLRGESLHSGTLNAGKLIKPVRDEDGWFATGDLGSLKKDYLYLQGRCKDTIIKDTGENVYPDELEDYFRELEGVEEFCVLGVRNDSNREEIVLAMVTTECYRQTGLEENLAAQILKINARLPFCKRIDRVLITQSLPTTTSMKIQRQKLKRLLEAGSWPYKPLDLKKYTGSEKNPKKDPGKEVIEEVREIFARILGKPCSEISDKAHFIENLGGDSLQAIELASTLEQKFQVFIPDSLLLECSNVLEISDAVLRQISADRPEDRLKLVTKRPKRTALARIEDTREYMAFAGMIEAVGELNPYFVSHDSTVRDTSLIHGQEVINMGSYNYLGFSGHPETVKAAQEAIQKYGTSASGSRLLTGEKTLYLDLERELAEWKQVDDALVLVSGHATNVTFVGNFCTENDLIIYDALSHNSIEQGCRLSKSDSKAFPHNDFDVLENILQQTRDYYEKILIIVEGVYSMDGDIAPIPKLVELKKKYRSFLMVDEAHSACVLGKTGKGVDEHFSLMPADIDVRMGTLSKGLGSCGGYLAGSTALISYLRYHLPGFVFSVGISPASAAVALAALRLLKNDSSAVERLHDNIDFFLAKAHDYNFNTCLAAKTAIIPILVGDERAAFLLSKRLQEKGVFVPPAVYPAVPKGKARLRFCVISEHKQKQMLYALDMVKECAHREEIELPAHKPQLTFASA